MIRYQTRHIKRERLVQEEEGDKVVETKVIFENQLSLGIIRDDKDRKIP